VAEVTRAISPSHTIVAGFGVPGRAVVEMLHTQSAAYCIVELNPRTVERCEQFGEHILEGDARDPQTLQRAGIERATLVVIAIPDQAAALEATRVARQLNPTAHIITRCHYISAGLIAKAHGANEVVIAEQVVAEELRALILPHFKG
jgi:monovalent cation:H+ antiporter-2, CPA2 family